MRSPPSIPIMTGSTIARAPTPTWSRWSRSHNGIRTTPKLELSTRYRCSPPPTDSTRHTGIKLKAGDILEREFRENPEHPGPAHYIIHAYDYPALVDRALAAAQKYAVCVTVVPHAIHMPSHTYVLLGRWQDTIKANDAAEVAEADRGTPEDRIHALDYLVYAHLQLAQDDKAKEALDIALKTESDLVARKHDSGLRARPFGVAAMDARWALERLDWAAAASLTPRPGRYPYAEAVPHFARAVGLARSGHPEQASSDIEQLAALQKTLADAKNLYWARQVAIELSMAKAWVERGLGRDAQALALMQEAATAEETSETHDTLSPGPIGMTAHEALGLLLLELGRPGEALPAFEASLRTAKNRLRSYAGAGRAAAAAGDESAARAYYTKLIEPHGRRNGGAARGGGSQDLSAKGKQIEQAGQSRGESVVTIWLILDRRCAVMLWSQGEKTNEPARFHHSGRRHNHLAARDLRAGE